jgi:hypothetical protein
MKRREFITPLGGAAGARAASKSNSASLRAQQQVRSTEDINE